MHKLRRLVIVVTCASMLTLAGCSDDDKPSSDPTTTPSPTVTSPTESPSTYTPPPAAKPPKGGWPEDKPATEISAEKVVLLWLRAYNHATITGDTSRMRRISANGCLQCKRFIEQIEDIYSSGGSVESDGPSYSWGRVRLMQADSPDHVELRVHVTASGGTTVPEAGADPISFDRQSDDWFFVVKLVGDRWRLREVGVYA